MELLVGVDGWEDLPLRPPLLLPPTSSGDSMSTSLRCMVEATLLLPDFFLPGDCKSSSLTGLLVAPLLGALMDPMKRSSSDMPSLFPDGFMYTSPCCWALSTVLTLISDVLL